MADQDPINPNNGQAPGDGLQVATIAQYIKDLSVESPNSPQVFQWQNQPQVDVQFNINVDQIADDVHEIVLNVNVGAKSDNGTHFMVDLTYAGLFGLRNVPAEAVPPFLLIEAPRLLFPFARQIISDSVQHLGFPPLLLDPIDFGSAFMAKMDAERAAGEGQSGQIGGTGTGGNGSALPPQTPTPGDDQA